jgi:hypothetical protein
MASSCGSKAEFSALLMLVGSRWVFILKFQVEPTVLTTGFLVPKSFGREEVLSY